MNHLSEQDIMLCCFGEPESQEHTEHLSTCERCSAELARLGSLLDRITPAEPPEPAPGYEQAVWERLRWKLSPHGRRSAFWLKWAAVAAAIILAFTSGLLWNRRPVAPEEVLGAQAGAVTAEQRDRILLAVIGDHFDRSERVLVDLLNLEMNGEIDITARQVQAEDLLESNRLYRQTASERGEDRVAALLDDLEPVLLQIARSPSQLTANEQQSIRNRVESRELLFKLRVIRAGFTDQPATVQPTI